MRLYKVEPAPEVDEDGNEIAWAPPIRYECVVSAHDATRLLNDGWNSVNEIKNIE